MLNTNTNSNSNTDITVVNTVKKVINEDVIIEYPVVSSLPNEDKIAKADNALTIVTNDIKNILNNTTNSTNSPTDSSVSVSQLQETLISNNLSDSEREEGLQLINFFKDKNFHAERLWDSLLGNSTSGFDSHSFKTIYKRFNSVVEETSVKANEGLTQVLNVLDMLPTNATSTINSDRYTGFRFIGDYGDMSIYDAVSQSHKFIEPIISLVNSEHFGVGFAGVCGLMTTGLFYKNIVKLFGAVTFPPSSTASPKVRQAIMNNFMLKKAPLITLLFLLSAYVAPKTIITIKAKIGLEPQNSLLPSSALPDHSDITVNESM